MNNLVWGRQRLRGFTLQQLIEYEQCLWDCAGRLISNEDAAEKLNLVYREIERRSQEAT